jgi:hypothetical protein
MVLMVHLLVVINRQACDHITLSVPWSFDRTLILLELIHYYYYFEKIKIKEDQQPSTAKFSWVAGISFKLSSLLR